MKTKTILITLIAMLAVTAFVFQSCKKDIKESDPQTPPTYTNGEGEIGPIGGTIIIEDPSSPIDGVTLEIPEGALLNNTIIKISQASSDIKYPLDSTAVVLKLEPAGTTFNEPVELAFPMPENLDTNFLSIYYFDPINHIVEKFPTEFDFANNEVITNIDHFSYYTMSDDGIFARVWMYYKNEKTTVRVRIYGRKDGGYYGFNGVPTFLSNYPWALQLIDEYEDITSNVVSQFDVQLRKNQYWPANIVEQQKLNIYRDMSYYTGDIDIKVYDESFAIPYYQINQSTSRERELFFGGEAICFNYNGELNNNDKYYPRIKMEID